MRAAFFAILVLTPSVALAAPPRTFAELVGVLVTILDSATGLLILAAIVIYFGGIAFGLRNSGDEGRRNLRTYITWGLVVIFIMVSVWGIIEILQNTIFGGDRFGPTLGEDGEAPLFTVPQFAE